MAKFIADLQNTINPPAFGQPLVNKLKANKFNGRIRIFEATYVAPSSGTAPAIADVIIWGKLPVKARILGHMSKLYWNTGTASCTLNLGDSLVAARHLAATAINATGSAIPEAAALIQTTVADVTISTNTLTNVKSIGGYQLGAIITGTGLAAGTVVTGIDYNSKTVTFGPTAASA